MTSTIDPSRYVYEPGVSQVGDIDLDETVVYVNGVRYTEADAEADADEAERSQAAGLIPGGKSLSGGTRHSPAVRVVLSERTLAQVKERARQSHMSVSRYVRGVVERDLATR